MMQYIITMEYYLVIKNEIMPFAATWTDLEIIILSEVSQTETSITWYHFFVESEIRHIWTNIQNINRLTDIENSPVVAKGEDGGRMDWEFGISRCKLVYLEWINNNVLLYRTGNYIQYPVINHNGKEYIHTHIYIYIKLNHFAVEQKLTQHCKSTILQ